MIRKMKNKEKKIYWISAKSLDKKKKKKTYEPATCAPHREETTVGETERSQLEFTETGLFRFVIGWEVAKSDFLSLFSIQFLL